MSLRESQVAGINVEALFSASAVRIADSNLENGELGFGDSAGENPTFSCVVESIIISYPLND